MSGREDMLKRTHSDRRQRGLIALCLGVLIVVVDSTVVSVALPFIRADLNFSESSLVWVVNSYLLTFGGFLLLSGRLGDLYGHRAVFLVGIALFTLASLACGMANTQYLLVATRALQGLAGAVVMAAALSLIANMFPDGPERAKAMGIYGFVCVGGGAAGALLGGILTEIFNWRGIFLVNVPIGLAVYALCQSLLPRSRAHQGGTRLDIWGAVTLVSSLTLALFVVVGDDDTCWLHADSAALLAGAAVLLILFIIIEARVSTPLMPLRVLTLRNLTIANVIAVLLSAGGAAWFFISALYMQLVLGYEPMRIGLAFLPANIITAALSLRISDKLVTHFGIKKPLGVGMLLIATGLFLFARAPVDGTLVTAILPGMILLGVGEGIAYNPLLLAALSEIEPDESGVASGLVSTTSMMGGALGLAILVNLATARTNELLASGATHSAALAAGFRVAFLMAALLVAMAALLGLVFLRMKVRALRP